jgi:hypothetical protein
MISVGGVMFLFGLTWLFGILTFSVDGLREAFQILFTIFNSFQGFFIFLFFCAFNKEALESWKELLSCGKYTSKLLHPSKAKYNSTAMANKVNQSKSGTIGLAVYSREKYASGSSVFDYHSRSATPEREDAHQKFPPETTKVNLQLGTIENPNVEDNGILTLATPECTTVPAIIVEQADSINGGLQGEGAAGSSGEIGKKKKNGLSLKARIKCYTTKKILKHNEEEVEIHFNNNQASGGTEDTTTQL